MKRVEIIAVVVCDDVGEKYFENPFDGKRLIRCLTCKHWDPAAKMCWNDKSPCFSRPTEPFFYCADGEPERERRVDRYA